MNIMNIIDYDDPNQLWRRSVRTVLITSSLLFMSVISSIANITINYILYIIYILII